MVIRSPTEAHITNYHIDTWLTACMSTPPHELMIGKRSNVQACCQGNRTVCSHEAMLNKTVFNSSASAAARRPQTGKFEGLVTRLLLSSTIGLPGFEAPQRAADQPNHLPFEFLLSSIVLNSQPLPRYRVSGFLFSAPHFDINAGDKLSVTVKCYLIAVSGGNGSMHGQARTRSCNAVREASP